MSIERFGNSYGIARMYLDSHRLCVLSLNCFLKSFQQEVSCLVKVRLRKGNKIAVRVDGFVSIRFFLFSSNFQKLSFFLQRQVFTSSLKSLRRIVWISNNLSHQIACKTMGNTSAVISPEIFASARAEYEAKKSEGMSDEDLFNHMKTFIEGQAPPTATEAAPAPEATTEPEKAADPAPEPEPEKAPEVAPEAAPVEAGATTTEEAP